MSWREAYVGGKSVGVPGVLRALADAHQLYGKLPWEELFTDAITLAEQGFPVTARTAKQLAFGWNQGLKQLAPANQYFYPGGEPLPAGHLLKNPEYAALDGLADLLQEIAEASGQVSDRLALRHFAHVDDVSQRTVSV